MCDKFDSSFEKLWFLIANATDSQSSSSWSFPIRLDYFYCSSENAWTNTWLNKEQPRSAFYCILHHSFSTHRINDMTTLCWYWRIIGKLWHGEKRELHGAHKRSLLFNYMQLCCTSLPVFFSSLSRLFTSSPLSVRSPRTSVAWMKTIFLKSTTAHRTQVKNYYREQLYHFFSLSLETTKLFSSFLFFIIKVAGFSRAAAEKKRRGSEEKRAKEHNSASPNDETFEKTGFETTRWEENENGKEE